MGRSRYKIYENNHPYFITCTVIEWLPIFTRVETVQILVDSINYLKDNNKLKLFAYVFLENHIHLIVESDNLQNDIKRFKSYTARLIIDLLKAKKEMTILEQLKHYKKKYKIESEFQVWEEGYAPKEIKNDDMMRERIYYIHSNPVKRGYVDEAKHWRYSSARNYEGLEGMLEIDEFI